MGKDWVIADVNGVGESSGVFGGFSDLGIDMFGDFQLDADLPPVVQPRESSPPSATVVSQALVTARPPQPVEKKAAQVTRSTEKPETPRPTVVFTTPPTAPVVAVADNKRALLMLGGAAFLVYFLSRK